MALLRSYHALVRRSQFRKILHHADAKQRFVNPFMARRTIHLRQIAVRPKPPGRERRLQRIEIGNVANPARRRIPYTPSRVAAYLAPVGELPCVVAIGAVDPRAIARSGSSANRSSRSALSTASRVPGSACSAYDPDAYVLCSRSTSATGRTAGATRWQPAVGWFFPAGILCELTACRRAGLLNQMFAGTGWPQWRVFQVTPVSATWVFQSALMCRTICSIRRDTTLV